MKKWLFVVALAFMVCVNGTSRADRFADEVKTSKPELYYQRFNTTIWDEKSDEPFRLIRQRIDEQFSKKKLSESVIASYRKIAEQSPSDATAQFRWSYAQYLVQGRYNGTFDQMIAEALAKPRSPKSYEYTRIQFIYEANDVYAGMLAPMARRLLSRDPKDIEMRYYASWVLMGSRDKKTVLEAVPVASELLKAQPKSPRFAYRVAFCHEIAYAATKDPRYGKSAVAAYRYYLTTISETDERYKGVQNLIKSLEKRLAKS